MQCKRHLFVHVLSISMALILFISVPSSYSQTENSPTAKLEDIEFTYDPTGRRDPFYSELLEEKKPEGEQKTLFGLQKFELTELTLVGIVWGGLGRKAVIEAPDGKAYLAAAGTLVGKNEGTVKSVTNEEIYIQEFTKDYLGNKVEKITVLKIKPNEEGQ